MYSYNPDNNSRRLPRTRTEIWTGGNQWNQLDHYRILLESHEDHCDGRRSIEPGVAPITLFLFERKNNPKFPHVAANRKQPGKHGIW